MREPADLSNPPTEMPDSKPPQNKKLFWIIGAVAVVGLFALAGLFVRQQAGPNQVWPTPELSPQPQAEVLDTSDWQTYRSEEFRFEDSVVLY